MCTVIYVVYVLVHGVRAQQHDIVDSIIANETVNVGVRSASRCRPLRSATASSRSETMFEKAYATSVVDARCGGLEPETGAVTARAAKSAPLHF